MHLVFKSLKSYFLALDFDARISFPHGSFEQEGGCIGPMLFCLEKELCDNILASGKHWLIVYLNAFFKFRQKGALFNRKGIHIALLCNINCLEQFATQRDILR